jgi:hypothetical protein
MTQNLNSANQSPVFTLIPRIGTAWLTGANLTLSGTPLPQLVISAGDQGSMVLRTEYHSTITNSASMINIFLCDTGGTTGVLFRQYPITGSQVTGASGSAWMTADTMSYELPSGWTIRAAQMAANTGYVLVSLGDY